MPRKNRPNLTVAAVDRLGVPPGRSRVEVGDGKVPGLALRATRRGVKTFSYVYRSPLDGRQRRVTLGSWPKLASARSDALEEVRARALQLAAEVAAGRDPVADEKRRESEARAADARSLRWLAEQYVELEARPSIATWRSAQRTLERHWLPSLGDVPFKEISRAQLYTVLDGLRQSTTSSMTNAA